MMGLNYMYRIRGHSIIFYIQYHWIIVSIVNMCRSTRASNTCNQGGPVFYSCSNDGKMTELSLQVFLSIVKPMMDKIWQLWAGVGFVSSRVWLKTKEKSCDQYYMYLYQYQLLFCEKKVLSKGYGQSFSNLLVPPCRCNFLHSAEKVAGTKWSYIWQFS